MRNNIIGQREAIPPKDTQAWSEAIASHITGSAYFREAQAVFCFVSVGNEPDTSPIIEKALSDGKIVYVPRTTQDRHMETVPVTSEDWQDAYTEWPCFYGIPEPPQELKPAAQALTTKATAQTPAIDLVLVPSLAVDTEGYRLGYGGGYYDRFISESRTAHAARTPQTAQTTKNQPLFAAIQFSRFIMQNDPLPREKHDMRVDVIVSENGIILPSYT